MATNRTSFVPVHRIGENKLMEIYAMMIINLKLTDTLPNKKLLNFTKTDPYSFTLKNAITTMQNLHLDIQLSKTTTSITYNIKPDLAKILVHKFYHGKFLHCPSDRTLLKLMDGVSLQPTPKGLAIVHEFCKNIGIKKGDLPPILFTKYNSMEIIKLDRDSISDKIVYSDYFVHVLFQRMLGKFPNIWTCYNPPDELPNKFDDEYLHDESFLDIENRDIKSPFSIVSNIENQKEPPVLNKAPLVSPYYHRYFTNPELDSHVQYYVSSKGARFQDKLVFHTNNQELMVKNCITGKSITQWLCDCSDIVCTGQAIEIGNLFLKLRLLDPVPFLPSKANSYVFSNSRDYYYTVSKIGRQISLWSDTKLKSPKTTSNLKEDIDNVVDKWIDTFIIYSDQEQQNEHKITLSDVLYDPGLRYLFRQHLETDLCTENLDAYLRLKHYEKKVVLLGKLLKSLPEEKESVQNEQLSILADDCISIAFNVFATYLSLDAPFVVNIDYHLRNRITSILTNPKNLPDTVYGYLKTPIKTHFDHNGGGGAVETDESSIFLTMTRKEGSESQSQKSNLSESPRIIPSSTQNENTNQPCVIGDEISNNINPSWKLSHHDITEISTSLNTLSRVTITFQEIKRELFKMMETDSFPKFLDSDLCKQLNQKIKIKLN
jgi:hypothetical protein